MHALQLILSVCPIALQTQKAWEARREYDQKQAEAAADEAGSFRGPDGSNQWVSVGELGAEALDDALMGLAGGSGLYSMYGTPSSGAASSKVFVRHSLIGLAAGRGCAGDQVMHSVQSKLLGCSRVVRAPC